MRDGDRPLTNKWDSLVTLVGFDKNGNAPQWKRPILNCPRGRCSVGILAGTSGFPKLGSHLDSNFVTCLMCKSKNSVKGTRVLVGLEGGNLAPP